MTIEQRIELKEYQGKPLNKLERAAKAVLNAGHFVNISASFSSAYVGIRDFQNPIEIGELTTYPLKKIRISNHTVTQSDSGMNGKYCQITGKEITRESYHSDKEYFAEIKSSKANLADNILKVLEVYA